MTVRSRLRSIILRLAPPPPKPVILMYHRIADEAIDPWALAVSPIHFEQQLDVLRRTRYPLSLGDFVRRLLAGTLPPNAVVVTFDDGYVDNLLAGKPRLAAADIPATEFLPTGYLGRAGEVWSDELVRLVLGSNSSSNLEIVIQGKVTRFELSEDAGGRSNGSWRAELIPPRTRREAAYLAICRALLPLNDEDRISAVSSLRAASPGKQDSKDSSRAMTHDEVRALAADGLVEIGAHTVTHPLMVELDAATCWNEISQSKVACEELTGTPVAAFAYPYGAFDSKVRAAVGEAGFSCACAGNFSAVETASDVLALPRMQVRDWDGDRFQRALHEISAGH
jgi:peptidoglycan/xylan/chitin deacetylase (PgdA/CDA1 family)